MDIRALALILSFPLTTAPADGQAHVGLMAGATWTKMSGRLASGATAGEFGAYAAITLERDFGNTWSFETGLVSVQKGGDRMLLESGGEEYGFRLHYLQVPALARARFPIAGGPWSLAPSAGLAIGINVRCELKPAVALGFEEECSPITPGGEASTLEVSVPIGLRLALAFPGNSQLRFDVRYETGLTNVLTTASETGQSVRNSHLLSGSFGFSLPLF